MNSITNPINNFNCPIGKCKHSVRTTSDAIEKHLQFAHIPTYAKLGGHIERKTFFCYCETCNSIGRRKHFHCKHCVKYFHNFAELKSHSITEHTNYYLETPCKFKTRVACPRLQVGLPCGLNHLGDHPVFTSMESGVNHFKREDYISGRFIELGICHNDRLDEERRCSDIKCEMFHCRGFVGFQNRTIGKSRKASLTPVVNIESESVVKIDDTIPEHMNELESVVKIDGAIPEHMDKPDESETHEEHLKTPKASQPNLEFPPEIPRMVRTETVDVDELFSKVSLEIPHMVRTGTTDNDELYLNFPLGIQRIPHMVRTETVEVDELFPRNLLEELNLTEVPAVSYFS